MTRAYPVVLLALALLAGNAGYVTHRALNQPDVAELQQSPLRAAANDNASAAGEDPDTPLAWTFVTLDGTPRRLDKWPGELVVLNFWATWCPPCLREIPAFIALQDKYRARGVQFIGVALDQAAAVAPFVAERGVNYPIVLGDDAVVRLMQRLGNDIGGLPYTVVLRGEEVVFAKQGEWHADSAETTLLELLQ